MIAVAVVVGAAGAGAGATFLIGGRHAARETAQNASESTPIASPSVQDGSAPAPAPPAPSPGPSRVGQVTIAPDVAQEPDASPVAVFVNQYFSAINGHDYQSYVSLLNAQEQQGLTRDQFDRGYGSTSDTAETIVGISTAPDGDLDVTVTFTSHQNPADSPNQDESCTDWRISLFLAQGGSGYLIDVPPPGYHASYAACP